MILLVGMLVHIKAPLTSAGIVPDAVLITIFDLSRKEAYIIRIQITIVAIAFILMCC